MSMIGANPHHSNDNIFDARHLLTPEKVEACKQSLLSDISGALHNSHAIKDEQVGILTASILEAATIDDVFTNGEAEGRVGLANLHLGFNAHIGETFADCVAPGQGPAALTIVSTIFYQMQIRFRCLMLAAWAAQELKKGNALTFTLQPDPGTGCAEIWDQEQLNIPAERLPMLPLKRCSNLHCKCTLQPNMEP